MTALLGAGVGRTRDLLADYRPGSSFFFASPRASLLARGSAMEVPSAPAGVDLGEYVTELLGALGSDAITVGALPFDPRGQAHLVVPDAVHRGGPGLELAGSAPAAPAALPLTSDDHYLHAVEQAITAIASGEVTKVVLARACEVVADTDPDVATLLHRLAVADPRAYVFATDLPGDRVLVGASPELLVRRQGRVLTTQPMAGSIARSGDAAEDAERAVGLRSSGKDREEHRIVVDAMVERLRPFAETLDVPAEASVVGTAAMWHLASRIRVTLADPVPSSLTLARVLHPTPAVCGSPVEAAAALIDGLESFDRGFYAGLVGWTDAAGDGEWALSLRCAELSGRRARLFAGAGIVAGSRPEAELAETEAKLATVRRALAAAR